MPVVIPPGAAGSGPGFTGTPPILTFGGLALPNGQGTQANINLNNLTSWFWQDYLHPGISRQIGAAQQLYRGKSVILSDDFAPFALQLSMRYDETPGPKLGTALAQLSQAGEQQLSFDGATYILAKLKSVKSRKLLRRYSPYYWSLDLEFYCRIPWFQDITASTLGSTALTTDAGTNFTITYSGSVFCEPVFTLTIPVGNAVALNSFQLKNTTSSEFLTVNFQSVAAIPASTARTVTIDCAAMTAIDGNGNNYDVTGSFPMLYPPTGQVNSFTTIVTTASGTSSGLTLTAAYNNRWEM